MNKGRQIYVICAACHGPRGQGEQRLEAPRLAGQQASYLLRQLANFGSGVRGSPADPSAAQMRQMVLDVVSTQVEREEVVAYIRSFPAQASRPMAQGDRRKGRTLYERCAACHGQEGEGNEALEAPSLRWLPDWYIAGELRKFREGARGSASGDLPGNRMRAVAATLESDHDVRAVASFISSR